jgi:hypothetical protein
VEVQNIYVLNQKAFFEENSIDDLNKYTATVSGLL